ncbi:MAG: hypothetical protein BMS9Abin22_572 [Gammaproteobacteria bacterium]|nr:MAG: hypothetical protein BMS9Abin22_572 [Gammaproteobacteria bacterium]
MIWLRRNLTGKFVLLLIGFLVLQGVQLATGLFGILHIGEEGAFINDAGRQRMRTLLLARIAHQALNSDSWQTADRRLFEDTLADYDAHFIKLAEFAATLRIRDQIRGPIDEVRTAWEKKLKPLLLEVDPARPKAARAALARYDALAPAQIARLDQIVTAIEDDVREDAQDLAIFQTVVFGLSLFLGIIGLIMARRVVALPLRKLTEATRAIAAGAYGRRVEVLSRDELGELGNTFNQMSTAVGEKTARIAALNQIAVAITSTLSLEDILKEIMRRGVLLTASKASCIAFYDQESGRFKEWVTHGLSEHFVKNMAFRRGGLADEAFTAAESYILSNDCPETKHKLSKLARDEGILSFVCLPLSSQTNRLGVIYFYRTDRDTFTSDEIELLTTLAALAAGAIENARLHARTADQAATDALTGLPNRRILDQRLTEELRRAQRYNKSLSLMLLDIDHFKKVNDNYGHLAGDAVLKTLAKLLSKQIRDVDFAARYGGEEFMFILPETDSPGAKLVAQRIRRAVADTPFPLRDGRKISVTVSIGIVCFPHCGESAQELTERADQALYTAKLAGRNRVELYHGCSRST